MVESLWLVIQNKTKVLHESEIKLNGRNGQKKFRIKDLNIPNGGVVTVQLFRKKSFGKPDQETIIYIHPKARLVAKVSTDKKIYIPGDTVELTVDHKSGEEDVLWGIVVSDETANLQIDKKRHPPSLITKVFLENELFFKSKEFQGAYRYLDWFFENGKKKPTKKELKEKIRLLDVMMGNQGWRMFFLAGDKLREIIDSNDALGKDKKGNFEYLLAKKLSNLGPRLKRDMMFRPMEMAFAAPPQMAMARGGVENFRFKENKTLSIEVSIIII
jgi:hypothetical protein